MRLFFRNLDRALDSLKESSTTKSWVPVLANTSVERGEGTAPLNSRFGVKICEVIVRNIWFLLIFGLISASPLLAGLSAIPGTLGTFALQQALAPYLISFIGALILPELLVSLRDRFIWPWLEPLYKKLLMQAGYSSDDSENMTRPMFNPLTMSQRLYLMYRFHFSNAAMPIDLKVKVSQQAARLAATMNATLSFTLMLSLALPILGVIAASSIASVVGLACYLANQNYLNRGLNEVARRTPYELQQLAFDADQGAGRFDSFLKWFGLSYSRLGLWSNRINTVGILGCNLGASWFVLLKLPALAWIATNPFLLPLFLLLVAYLGLQVGLAFNALGYVTWCNLFKATESKISQRSILLTAPVILCLFSGLMLIGTHLMLGTSLLGMSAVSMLYAIADQRSNTQSPGGTLSFAAVSLYFSIFIALGLAALNGSNTMTVLAALGASSSMQLLIGGIIIGIGGGFIANLVMFSVAVVSSFANFDQADKPATASTIIEGNKQLATEILQNILGVSLVLPEQIQAQPQTSFVDRVWQHSRVDSGTHWLAKFFNALGVASLQKALIAMTTTFIISSATFATGVLPFLPAFLYSLGFVASLCIVSYSWRTNTYAPVAARGEAVDHLAGFVGIIETKTGVEQEQLCADILHALMLREPQAVQTLFKQNILSDAGNILAKLGETRGQYSDSLYIAVYYICQRVGSEGLTEAQQAALHDLRSASDNRYKQESANDNQSTQAKHHLDEAVFCLNKVDTSVGNLAVLAILRTLALVPATLYTLGEWATGYWRPEVVEQQAPPALVMGGRWVAAATAGQPHPHPAKIHNGADTGVDHGGTEEVRHTATAV